MSVPFDARGFGRFLYGWMFRLPWTFRRVLITAAFLVLYPVLLLVTLMCLALDRLLFPGFRQRQVTAPVFIIGNFRSGTTFLHRLLAKDESNFRSMAMWEILFAPSVLARRLVLALARLDRLLHRPAARATQAMESRWRALNPMHRVALAEPEEDEYLMLHAWSSLTIGLSSGLLDQARGYAWFDQLIPGRRRQALMGYYHRCLQRHLHAHGAPEGVHYLAKNPAASPKLASLLQEFPDARVIYLVRTPSEAVPSFLSMMDFSWRAVGAPGDGDRRRRFLLDMMGHWYRYPPALLADRPAHTWALVKYDDLMGDPAGVVTALYRRLDLSLGAEFRKTLEHEARRAAVHSSRHDYSAEAVGLDPATLTAEFGDVFEAFGWPAPGITRRASEAPATACISPLFGHNTHPTRE